MAKPERNVSLSNEFFKVYLSDFSSRQLSLPPAFAIQFNAKSRTLPKNATLKDGSGKIWNVGLEKKEGGLIINDGWKNFIRFHSLADGDFLIFKYDKDSHFDVELYGVNGLKKEGKGVDEIHVKEEQEIEEERIGPGRNCKQKDSEIELRRSRRSKGSSGGSGAKSSETVAARKREHKVDKAPSSPARKVLSFEMSITRTKKYARIPKRFMREHGIEMPNELKLRLGNKRKLWPVQVSSWDSGYSVFTSGFFEFCRMNNLLPRDKCLFKFTLKKGNLCNEIQVQVVRGSPRSERSIRARRSRA